MIAASSLLVAGIAWLPSAGLQGEATAGAELATEPLAERVEHALAEGVRWLVENQADDGTWGSHHTARPIEVYAEIPGAHDAFRVATTGLAVSALYRSRSEAPGVREAIERGVEALLAQHDVRRMSGIDHYNVWGLGFGLQGLGDHLHYEPLSRHAEAARAACETMVARLGRQQHLDGGWGYLSIMGLKTHPPSDTSMSFTTATVLVGLRRAQDAGVEIPDELLERALDSVARCRTPTGTFSYGELWNKIPASGFNQEKGAACRTPCCQHALGLFGREVPEGERERALEDLLVRHARFQLLGLRRPIPHEAWHQISGYFYLFGHAYAALALADLPASERKRFAPHLAEAVLACREPSGAFWDYPLYSYHYPYGTAFAILALCDLEL